MFRSLFARLFFTFVVTMTAIIILLSVVLIQTLQKDYVERYVVNLTAEVNYLAEVAKDHFTDPDWQGFDPVALKDLSKLIASRYDITLWLVYTDGSVDVLRGGGSTTVDKEQLTKAEMERYFPTLENGKMFTLEGAFGGRFREPVLTVVKPVVMQKEGSGSVDILNPEGAESQPQYDVVGTILMHAPLSEIQSVYQTIYLRVWIAALISLVCGVIISTYLSSRLSKPLSEMNNVAKDISKGIFERKVHIATQDEIGQLGKTFNEMAAALKNLEEMRMSFIGNVSHELRSPMTSIQGYVQGMLDGTISPQEQEHYLQVVLSETQRLTKLVRELLDLSQIESGNFPLKWGAFDINELVRRALIRFEGKIDAKTLDVEVDFEDEPMLVYADQDRIEQVVTNLLDNAIKFSEQNGYLGVKTQRQGGKVRVLVKDSGPGISKNDLSRIWERFYKVDRAHTRGTGTGLGLSIVKRIIEQHNQSVQAIQNSDTGMTFFFTLAPSDGTASPKS